MTVSPRLDDDVFATVIRNTPLVSIDLIIMSPENKVLLGRRVNEPARNFWFAYGGRIVKDEPIGTALERISAGELGVTLRRNDAAFLGVFEHFYDRNYFGQGDFGTHYVVLAHKFILSDDPPVLPDSQHEDHCWWTIADLLAAPDVHPYTKAYFQS